MASVSLEQIYKQFPDGNVAVDRVDLMVRDQEFLVLVGPSGCGKSSTLRMIAGLDVPTSGEIRIGDRVVNDVAPKDRDIAMVFQNYALYPHMSVYKNMAFGLLLRYGGGVLSRGLRSIFKPRKSAELNQLRSGVDHQVRQTADRLAISDLLDRKPYQLSGGERQRVALGRAIVRDPAVFLFDEPLSNLDAQLRQQMRVELRRLHGDLGVTMIYVTHDQVEAMTLGDRIAVMREGRVLQIGRPLDVYQRPANLFVAKFIGNTPANIVSAAIEVVDDQMFSVVCGAKRSEVRWSHVNANVRKALEQRVEAEVPASVMIGFRSEHGGLSLGQCSTDFQSVSQRKRIENPCYEVVSFAGTIGLVDRLGNEALVEIRLDEDPTTAQNSQQSDSHITVRSSPELTAEVGQPITVNVATRKLMWFDPKTGENLDRDSKIREKT
jgi:multiple sugar transport system ATP-binding protein